MRLTSLQNRLFLLQSAKPTTFPAGDSTESPVSSAGLLFAVIHDQALVLGLALTRSSHCCRFRAFGGRWEPPSGAPKVMKQ